ncbi:hypothetical protein E2C01_067685 [Portunus trituberculatus]|uniref:Uncharacterized protein n=1 Tax=Portunus trituberculatus TaxID=210409 RepID=A0A5B7HUB8_PORTR|nr:hypothetical protein [Portunus trituberculatus]
MQPDTSNAGTERQEVASNVIHPVLSIPCCHQGLGECLSYPLQNPKKDNWSGRREEEKRKSGREEDSVCEDTSVVQVNLG